MKALFTSVALVTLLALVYPAVGKADFNLSNIQNQDAQISQIQNSNFTNTALNDPLTNLLTQYLNDHGSPLSQYAAQISKLPNWKKDLAISYVESHMGVYCFNNNCSGMGGAPGTSTWRKYQTKLDWFIDLDNLMSKPMYSQTYNTCQKMKGIYVQPGSASWVYGCQKIYSELTNLEEQANTQQQLALATAK